MKSKGYLRFYNRLQYFLADNELIDILMKNKEEIAGEAFIFKEMTSECHPITAAYKNTPHARGLAIYHLRNTLFVAYIKELYEEVTEYLRYVLEHGAKNGANIGRLVGEHKVNFDANFILSATSHDIVIKAVTDHIFQQLENEKSTLELIKKIDKKLDLKLDINIINEALPYLLIRHLFVHSDGKPTEEFRSQYPQFKLNTKGKIDLSALQLSEVTGKVDILLKSIDGKMLEKNYFPSKEIQK
jgi:hypothetical protein